MKERVTLSRRPLKDGVESLFLNYRIGGVRRRENLRLYLVPEKTPMDKAKNLETMRVAKACRDRREFELEQLDAGLEVKARPRLVKFADYARTVLEKYKNRNTYKNFKSGIEKVERYFPGVMMQEMDQAFYKRLVARLEDDGLKTNTVRKIVVRSITILREAKDDGLLNDVPRIRGILPKPETVMRDFLTIDELRLLDAAPCPIDVVKRAFLFSCFTGLRFSDVANLRYSMIQNGTIVIRQVKTREPVTIPISENAYRYIERRPLDKYVFPVPTQKVTNNTLKAWGKAAGISKYMHYHLSRHTFATLALDNGAELLTVSRLLGHTSIATTTIYTRTLESAKRKAVELIPKI